MDPAKHAMRRPSRAGLRFRPRQQSGRQFLAQRQLILRRLSLLRQQKREPIRAHSAVRLSGEHLARHSAHVGAVVHCLVRGKIELAANLLVIAFGIFVFHSSSSATRFCGDASLRILRTRSYSLRSVQLAAEAQKIANVAIADVSFPAHREVLDRQRFHFYRLGADQPSRRAARTSYLRPPVSACRRAPPLCCRAGLEFPWKRRPAPGSRILPLRQYAISSCRDSPATCTTSMWKIAAASAAALLSGGASGWAATAASGPGAAGGSATSAGMATSIFKSLV